MNYWKKESTWYFGEERNMLELSNVTLVAVSSIRLQQTKKALEYSCRRIHFGEVLFLSDKKPWNLPDDIHWIEIKPMKSIQDYNYFLLYELWKYIKTEYALINHYDGFVVHPELWDERFLDYDYIGAPWPVEEGKEERMDERGEVCRVGNGVSLRSKKLMQFMDQYQIPFEPYAGTYSEDVLICVQNKYRLEEHGLKIAPLELAAVFSHENDIPERDPMEPTFLFHEWGGTNRRYPKFWIARWIDKLLKI
jgi:hypothetical protein